MGMLLKRDFVTRHPCRIPPAGPEDAGGNVAPDFGAQLHFPDPPDRF